jgi:glycosyltransferase involved in cell wall biosynthesis
MMRIAIARYFAHNVVVSECTNRRLNFPRKILIPNPHPLEIFQTARYGAKRTTDFLFVGRLVSEKGCHLILEALALIKSMGKYYSLLIVGNGDEVGKLKALSIEKDLSEQVTFLDGKKGEELAQIMAGCAVGIVPSLWAEPYGGVAVELMAAGLPVITTEDSGPEDKIATVGATVPKGDVVALADAMQRTLEFARANPEQVAIELNQNIAPFSEALLLKQYEKLLIQMLTRSPTQ